MEEAVPLFKEDEELFARMEGNYQSENERVFFETLKHRQQYEPVKFQDTLYREEWNEDGFYLFREGFGEYFLDPGSVHTMNLNQLLNTNLKEIGALDRDITMFEWLRERDYRGIRYDQDFEQ